MTITAVVAIAAAGALWWYWPAGENARPEPPALYAYRATGELGIVVGDQVTHRVAGTFTDPRLTTDGRRLIAVERSGQPTARVVVVDTGDGSRFDLPCGGCDDAVPAGPDGFAWVERTGKLVTVAGGTTSGAAPVVIRLPETAEYTAHHEQGISDSTLRVHAGTGDRFLVSRQYEDAGDTTEIFLVTADGSAKALDDEGTIGATAVAPDGKRLAYVRGYQHEAASANIDVAIVDPMTGTRTALVDSQQLESGIFHAGYGPAGEAITVSDLWWGRDGNLYATIESASFLPWAQDMQTIFAKSLWRLDKERWVSVDAGPLLAIRQLSRSTKAIVTAGGTLFTEMADKRTQIATSVASIVMPPLPADASASPTGSSIAKRTEPCLSKAEFDATASRLGTAVFEGSAVTVKAVDVTCQGGWAAGWTTIRYDTGVSRESYVILRYAKDNWIWGADSYWKQLGEPDEMCEQVPPKIKPAVRCPRLGG
ncbi:hypothetical protein Drose_15575 [Dactylosporangium roseum]|uniref:WD40 repeat domain-containing protein n=1 Tax=Dactylosporangium roseum TaxID=47989 RepID=A0ABY5ZGY0_9ACTN|nr:hypothetical protein [Dactylosporangium roseum]UWZ39524.1 hypothetical protein Drose_15575 [Dactylosporangium roseum]